jgi:hypothetical protein
MTSPRGLGDRFKTTFYTPVFRIRAWSTTAHEQAAVSTNPQMQTGVQYQSSAADQQFADYRAAGPSCRLNPYMDVAAVRRKFPHIADQPDEFLRSQSYSELAIANAAIAKLEDKASTARWIRSWRQISATSRRNPSGWRPAGTTP